MTELKNTSILCVDDEEGVLEAYRSVLQPKETAVSEILALSRRRNGLEPEPAKRAPRTYRVFSAPSGEKAVAMVREVLAQGGQIAAGFFDMRMPGGMDGFETIKAIRELDTQMACAVVTAYTDRSVQQIRDLFRAEEQDQLLYFKKPFTSEELEQTALNLVSSWNRKRKEEEFIRAIGKSKNSLKQILEAIGSLSRIPPHSLNFLLSGILLHLMALVDGKDGFIAIFDEKEEYRSGCGFGSFEGKCLDACLGRGEVYKAVLAADEVRIDGRRILIPMTCARANLGVIHVDTHSVPDHTMLKESLDLFRNQMVQLILNTLYYDELLEKKEKVVTDPLTGLYNRRFIMERLREELSRASRFNYPVAVLMIDIDDFKKVNDTFGHEAGDRVLVAVGRSIQAAVRHYDVVGRNTVPFSPDGRFTVRYGGEEFSVILMQAQAKDVPEVAERIRKKVAEDTVVCMGGQEIRVTVSIGISAGQITRTALSREDLVSALLQQADTALYAAKRNGKNRVEFCTT